MNTNNHEISTFEVQAAIKKYLKDHTNSITISDSASQDLWDLCDLAEKLGFQRGWQRCENEMHRD